MWDPQNNFLHIPIYIFIFRRCLNFEKFAGLCLSIACILTVDICVFVFTMNEWYIISLLKHIFLRYLLPVLTLASHSSRSLLGITDHRCINYFFKIDFLPPPCVATTIYILWNCSLNAIKYFRVRIIGDSFIKNPINFIKNTAMLDVNKDCFYFYQLKKEQH